MKNNKVNIYKKPNKFWAWVNKKGKWVLLSLLIFAVFGITALIVGFGLANGWLSVLRWFGSKWAIMIYVLIVFIIFGAIWFIHKAKMEK